MADIPHPQANEVTGSKFAVDGQIEKGEFAPPDGELQSNANGPDLFEKGVFSPTSLPLFQGRRTLAVYSVASIADS
jgi:hypothetical protein